ncbi:MAG: heavy-metal-associated domain-containing protein [Nitrospiraceae bacterium]|nr:MAG: heavy-metal-associated domain-containing protein [Nitrospiraceae bacterium]
MGKDIKEMSLQTGGIVCTGCVEDMERILRETEGIVDASVNYQDETVHVKYAPGLIDRKKVYAAVRKLVNVLRIISES